jgi:hypothetical protein
MDGGFYGNGLQVASLCGHEKIVQMLLGAGAEDDERSDENSDVSASK